MACMGMRRPGQSLEDRMAQVNRAIARLKKYLASGQVKVSIGPNGAIAFVGWTDRDDLSDACTYRSLSAESSIELRQAVARAEALSGRRVNPTAVASGHHSHDGGRTWHKGH